MNISVPLNATVTNPGNLLLKFKYDAVFQRHLKDCRGCPSCMRKRTSRTSLLTPLRWTSTVNSATENHMLSQHVNAVQILHRLCKTRSHGLLSRTQRHTWVVILLVRLRLALWVADLRLKVVHMLFLILVHAIPKRPLSVRVNVHLDDTRLDRILDVFLGRPRASVEHELHWLILLATQLFLDV